MRTGGQSVRVPKIKHDDLAIPEQLNEIGVTKAMLVITETNGSSADGDPPT